jgi:hypothetical protein
VGQRDEHLVGPHDDCGAGAGGAAEFKRRSIMAAYVLAPGTYVPAGAWGAGLPSFSCYVETVSDEKAVFLVRENDADRFRHEHPDCVGARLLSMGDVRVQSEHAARLVTTQPPPGAIVNSARKRGAQRFDNERCLLTEDGRRELQAGVRRKLIVWSLDYRCGGVETYLNSGDSPTQLYIEANSSSTRTGAIKPGSTVLALATKVVTVSGVSLTWIRTDRGWANVHQTGGNPAVTRSILCAVGCRRQCGGICGCAPTCTQQVKSRHNCDYRLMLDRTMSLVDRGLIRITSRSQHRPDRAVWRGLPLDKRAMTVAVKQEILKSTARKETLLAWKSDA